MSGHGHVIPNADGSKARCGGPALCSTCAHELLGQPTPFQQYARAMDDEIARRVRTATVIKPGDHVLLTTIEPFGQDLAKMRDALLERFPGVEFTFVAGVTDIAIDRQDEAEPEPPPDASWVSFGKPGTRFDHD